MPAASITHSEFNRGRKLDTSAARGRMTELSPRRKAVGQTHLRFAGLRQWLRASIRIRESRTAVAWVDYIEFRAGRAGTPERSRRSRWWESAAMKMWRVASVLSYVKTLLRGSTERCSETAVQPMSRETNASRTRTRFYWRKAIQSAAIARGTARSCMTVEPGKPEGALHGYPEISGVAAPPQRTVCIGQARSRSR